MVGIYIYIDELIDDVLTPISKRIELFADETISITSSIQNFNDLGKIFTDYSKSFTVPASAVNNKIFSYWYENAVSDGFDQRKKYFGRIEIDDIPFRFGKFQLEKADKKDNMIESYTINFTGNLTQLKDRFKDDKLNILDYSSLNFDYTSANVSDILNGVSVLSNTMAFPLIGSNRRYECGTGSGSDITTVSGRIDARELFPAIPVYKIFDFIESRYGLTFSGVFLESLIFKKLWLYCKNAEKFTVKSEPLAVDIFTTTDADYFDLSRNEMIFRFISYSFGWFFRAFIRITPTVNTTPYTLNIFDNGVLYQSYENLLGSQGITFFEKQISQEAQVNGQYIQHRFTFSVSSEFPLTFTSLFQLVKRAGTIAYIYDANNTIPYTSQTTSTLLNIENYVPDISVESFVIGIVKAHNLMIIPLSDTSFEFITMDAYFQRGKYLDITKYCSTESEQISKPRIFKSIKFLFEKSENILNNAFRGLFNREYGDLDFTNENISSTEVYEVKLPFEDIMYERYIPPITDTAVTNFVTATLWNKDLQAYTPKPVLMYLNSRVPLRIDGTNTAIKYVFGGVTFDQLSYRLFTNEIEIAGTDTAFLYGFNFSDEVGVVNSENAFPKGLYDTYYANYVENLYNIRTRKVTVKAMLNTLIVNSIQLYDRIIYKNKRYTINTMTVDLTTKETTFELLSDFRQFTDSNLGLRNTNIQALVLDNTAQAIELQVFLNQSDLWRSKLATGFLAGTYTSGGNQYKDGLLTVSVPANTTAADRTDNILIEYYIGAAPTIISIPVLQYA